MLLLPLLILFYHFIVSYKNYNTLSISPASLQDKHAKSILSLYSSNEHVDNKIENTTQCEIAEKKRKCLGGN